MSGYAVDVDELAAVIAQMAACQRALADLAAEVESEAGRMHAEWDGLAKDAHASAYSSWRADFTEMSAALAGIRAVADTARANYTAAVGANVAMWEQLG